MYYSKVNNKLSKPIPGAKGECHGCGQPTRGYREAKKKDGSHKSDPHWRHVIKNPDCPLDPDRYGATAMQKKLLDRVPLLNGEVPIKFGDESLGVGLANANRSHVVLMFDARTKVEEIDAAWKFLQRRGTRDVKMMFDITEEKSIEPISLVPQHGDLDLKMYPTPGEKRALELLPYDTFFCWDKYYLRVETISPIPNEKQSRVSCKIHEPKEFVKPYRFAATPEKENRGGKRVVAIPEKGIYCSDQDGESNVFHDGDEVTFRGVEVVDTNLTNFDILFEATEVLPAYEKAIVVRFLTAMRNVLGK